MSEKQKLTIGGVALSLLANKPSPAELGAIFASMNDFDQMRFLASAMFELRQQCGAHFRADHQLRNVGRMICDSAVENSMQKGEARKFIETILEGCVSGNDLIASGGAPQ